MQTKALNTEVLNNSAPPSTSSAAPLPSYNTSLPGQLHVDHHHVESGQGAPPVPPRSVLQPRSSPLQSEPSSGPGDVSLPGAPPLHTHSSKFPVEREVIVKNSGEKQCKIPNLSDYMRRAKPSVAPDAPPKQMAWINSQKGDVEAPVTGNMVHEIASHQIYKAQPMPVLDTTKDSEPSPIRPLNPQDPATSTPEDGARGLPQRTYQSLKEMISSRFTRQNGTSSVDQSLSPQSQLRQHGVYIGTPPQPSPHIEMRGIRSHQQQQRLYEQQRSQQYQQTPQPSYKFQQPYPPNQYQETPTTWKTYNGEGAIPKSQSTDSVLGQPSCYPQTNGTEPVKSYSQENIPTTPYMDPRYNQSRPPLNQQYSRGGLVRGHQAGSSGRGSVYQTQNDQYAAGSVIVHAPQEGNPGQAEEQTRREPPNLKHEDDDEGGFVKRGGQSDSGRGSTVYSSAKTSAEDTTPPLPSSEATEWSDRVETELRHILNGGNDGNQGQDTLTPAAGAVAGGSTESFSSVSPPLPPLSPHSSDDTYRRPRLGGYGKSGSMWAPRTKDKRSHKHKTSNLLSSGLEIDSMLDENNSSDDEDYTDTRAIRKQLEGLENMYAQVLKLLGVKKNMMRYEASDPRVNKRRCGSVSSVPSSVSSRPIRMTDRRGRATKVRDVKGINKRFQRLESHVVTLARSVAHLSSEMRTQHIMMQEMEMMRGELAALRVQTTMHSQQAAAHQVTLQQQGAALFGAPSGGPQNTPKTTNSTPDKVKRLTKFFGDEPPLLRLFLRRLGYEKYASLFEKERIGLLELPFMSEERLHKLGIPLGPRLRIMQQAHLASPNTLCVL